MSTRWTRGRGLFGPVKPLLGDWRTVSADGDTAAAAMACTRRFSMLGKGWMVLDARWQIGTGREYAEIALFGNAASTADADASLGFHSFTSDGKQSAGRLADARDVHDSAIAFEAKMPAGLARMVYWPLEDGAPGFNFAVENKVKAGWNRFLRQHFVPAA